MVAVDSNVLVIAHRAEMPGHSAARECLRRLAQGNSPWGLPVFCLGEFVRVVTHPRVFQPPSTLDQALAALDHLLCCPSIRVLNPGGRYEAIFADCLRGAGARGNLAFDAQIAAVCIEHGATSLVTLDRDFSRFPEIRIAPIN